MTQASQTENVKPTLQAEKTKPTLQTSTLANKIQKLSQPIKSESSSLSMYKIRMEQNMYDNRRLLAKMSFGKSNNVQKSSDKVLMVVGATGAGKTTLINGMINYIFGVKWEDNFRFKLVTDECAENQAHSQTSMITAYTIYPQEGSPIDFTLTVIDTPGFGDTRGMQQDKLITQQIKEFFPSKDQMVLIIWMASDLSLKLLLHDLHQHKIIFFILSYRYLVLMLQTISL